jgi:predicted RNA-binding protein YlxR (DUF448 family)
VCRRKESKAALLRLAMRDRIVIEDPDQVVPGRGAYVCRSFDCLSKLRYDKRMQKAYRGQARALAPDIGLKLHLTNCVKNDSINR